MAAALQVTTFTTSKEIRAWYGYDAANSPYSQVVIAIFAPLLMEKLADTHANHGAAELTCEEQDTETKVYPCRACVEGVGDRLFTNANTHVSLPNRRVNLFGSVAINPVAYASLFISFSVIFQAFSFVTFGAHADYGAYRLALLRIIAILGALSTMAFALIPGGNDNHRYWEIPGLLTIVSNVLFGLSVVYYNAFLPLIVANHPEVVSSRQNGDADDVYEAVQRRVENEISSKGMTGGYAGGVLMLLVSGGVLLISGALAKDAQPHVIANGYKFTCLVAGTWWLVGTLACTAYMHPRPGPPLPFKKPDADASILERARYYSRVATLGWVSTARTLRKSYTNLPTTFLYLIIYFIYSDTFSTISSVGILYARSQLCLGPGSLFVVAVLVPLFALLGNMLWLKLSVAYNLSNRFMVVLILAASALIPAWGLLSFTGIGLGFQKQWEVYLLSVSFGLCLGGLQSYSRTLYANFVPPGSESEFFALYEVTDKGSSWLGPMIVAALNQGSSDGLRFAFVYLLVGTLVPTIVLFFFVDETKGRAEAEAYAEGESSKKMIVSDTDDGDDDRHHHKHGGIQMLDTSTI